MKKLVSRDEPRPVQPCLNSDDAPDPIMRWDRQRQIVYANRAAVEVFALPHGAVALGLTPGQMGLDADLAGLLEEEIESLFVAGSRKSVNLVLPGRSRHYELGFHAQRGDDGHTASVVCIARDITARVQAEQGARESAERTRRTFNAMADAVFVHPLLPEGFGPFLDVNDTACERYGYSRQEILELTAQDISRPMDAREHGKHAARTVLQRDRQTFEVLHRTKEGREFPVEICSTVIQLDGRPTILSLARDITDRVAAQRVLDRQQKTIEVNSRIATTFLSASSDDIYNPVLDIVLEALESPIGVFGYIDEAGDLICPSLTRTVWDQCDVDGKSIVFPRAAWSGPWGHALTHRRSVVTNSDLHPPEGHLPLSSSLAVPILHRERLIGQFIVANKEGGYDEVDQHLLESIAVQTAPVLRSILDRRRDEARRRDLEEQLRQTQKMEAIGRLAGGVAHDFNNILGAILGNASLALDELEPNSAVREFIDEINLAASRASYLTGQLLAFSRKQVVEPQAVDVGQVIEKMHPMLSRLLGEDIVLRSVARRRLGRVLVDPGQLEQVVMNLVINARDALPEGGQITLETGHRRASRDRGEEAPCVTLSVTDTGCGIPQAVRDKIFEPFFTTKTMGQGTGLGLSTVLGIIEQSGGHIDLSSTVGEGSCFTIALPILGESGAVAEASEPTPDRPHGRETILVVEDDDMVCRVTAKLLHRHDYQVLTAHTGHEALDKAAHYDGPIHLLFTDLVMPKMSGVELAEALTAARPRVKVLFTSGYTHDVIANHGLADRGIEFIAKPYTVDGLAARVRLMLDGDPTDPNPDTP